MKIFWKVFSRIFCIESICYLKHLFIGFLHSFSWHTQRKQAGLSQLAWPRLSFQGQERSTVHSTRSLPDNGTQMSLDFREKGRREPGRSEMAIQPTYYDYSGGEFMASAPSSGQNRLHQPQEITLFFLCARFVW